MRYARPENEPPCTSQVVLVETAHARSHPYCKNHFTFSFCGPPPTPSPVLSPPPTLHPLSRVSLSVSRGAVPLLILFPPSNTDIPAAVSSFSIVYYANIILKRSGRGTVRRIPNDVRRRPMAEIGVIGEGVGFVKYGNTGCTKRRNCEYRYFSSSALLLFLWKEDYQVRG